MSLYEDEDKLLYAIQQKRLEEVKPLLSKAMDPTAQKLHISSCLRRPILG
jgi:hypothetical protein